MAREYGKVLMSAWTNTDFTLEQVFSGPIPNMPRDWSLGLVAPNAQHIYAFYDADQRPLYVGRTYDPAVRWFRHKKKSFWWHDARTADLWLMVGPDRLSVDTEVVEVEKWFIEQIDPMHNKVRARSTCLGSK